MVPNEASDHASTSKPLGLHGLDPSKKSSQSRLLDSSNRSLLLIIGDNGRRDIVNRKSRGKVRSIEPLGTPILIIIKKRKIKELSLLLLTKLNTNPANNIGAGKTRLDIKTEEITEEREARRNPEEDLTKVSEEGQIKNKI